MAISLAVSATQNNLTDSAKALASRLDLPFTWHLEHFHYILLVTPEHLCLQKTKSRLKPLFVDFLSGKITYRRQNASLRNEALARSLGLKHSANPKIVDATAGLARDSFILASLGFEIILLERSPIIHALVEDGIARALQNQHVAPIVKRLQLIQTDAITWLNQLNSKEYPDLIYLDPMFPEKQKTALVKKEMQIFQDVITDEPNDETKLLTIALACATERVVVKRPRLAPALEGPKANFSIKGSSSRFDVYLTKAPYGIHLSAD